MQHKDITLEDKYVAEEGRVFITGIQALVRLMLDQKRMDQKAGLNTGGFISGYRGSPLGGLDQQLNRAGKHLKANNIVFKEGLNEDLGATAVWGSQHTSVFPGATVEGVFGMWYGKAPGVDRTGDVFKHANMAGVSANGGVVAVAGDDYMCKSSTLPSQSDFTFMDAEIPVLSPANIQEVLDYGLYAYAMSRHSGAWAGLIALADTMDSGATIDVSADRLDIKIPDYRALPEGGLHIRPKDIPLEKEIRHRQYKLPAVLDFARANRLDREVLSAKSKRLGIVVVGQAYKEVTEAFEAMNITLEQAAALGVGIYKVAMPWPLETQGIREFAKGFKSIMVVEHKRNLVENQIRAALYDMPHIGRPMIIGKHDEKGEPLLKDIGALTVPEIALAIHKRLPRGKHDEGAKAYIEHVERSALVAQTQATDQLRRPFYCSGCPHNSSTVVPDGSRALAGIGCHYMANFMDRDTDMTSQMGGEGVSWIGQSPFTSENHVFVNLGDGTYSHSGSLAIRASVAANTNITYKILYNDAVAMTGGQPTESGFEVPHIAQQLRAEGVKTIVIVADEPERYEGITNIPAGIPIEHRKDLDHIQRQMRETEGVSVIIYDQTCAAEKRRRRKRGLMAKAKEKALINPLVCEGCGDCSKVSNCISVEPIETEMGRKRKINQSTCNQDISCVDGFCPSFVTIEGAELKKKETKSLALTAESTPLPEPVSYDGTCNIIFTGVGGTGVTTVASILGMAAHVDSKSASVVDMTGLAQKGGAVFSHVKIGPDAVSDVGGRVPPAGADVVVGCDLIVAAGQDALLMIDKDRTRAVGNTDIVPTADFVTDRDKRFDLELFEGRVNDAVHSYASTNADTLAETLLGDTIFSNMIMMGFAWQRGLIPISSHAMAKAIELNGVAVEKNLQAFEIGRKAAHAPEEIEVEAPEEEGFTPLSQMSLDEIISHRTAELVKYQNQAYADVYTGYVNKVAEAEKALGSTDLTRAVAIYMHKLMAYKDEYEVGRLYTDGRFKEYLKDNFEDGGKMTFHLSPPLFAPKDPNTGLPRKIRMGSWTKLSFAMLAKMKGLRGTAFDIFGKTEERKMERQLVTDYQGMVDKLLGGLTKDNHKLAIEIASVPNDIRGFGHVKEASVKEVRPLWDKLWEQWDKA